MTSAPSYTKKFVSFYVTYLESPVLAGTDLFYSLSLSLSLLHFVFLFSLYTSSLSPPNVFNSQN